MSCHGGPVVLLCKRVRGPEAGGTTRIAALASGMSDDRNRKAHGIAKEGRVLIQTGLTALTPLQLGCILSPARVAVSFASPRKGIRARPRERYASVQPHEPHGQCTGNVRGDGLPGDRRCRCALGHGQGVASPCCAHAAQAPFIRFITTPLITAPQQLPLTVRVAACDVEEKRAIKRSVVHQRCHA